MHTPIWYDCDTSRALQGSKAAACGVYDRGLKAAAARGAAGSSAYAHLAIQYAHFLRVAYGDARGARAVYGEALRVLWEGAIHLEETLEGPVRCAATSLPVGTLHLLGL